MFPFKNVFALIREDMGFEELDFLGNTWSNFAFYFKSESDGRDSFKQHVEKIFSFHLTENKNCKLKC